MENLAPNIEAKSGLHYNKLNAPVRSYVDNLRAQVYEVMGKYDVTNMTEFIAKMKKVAVPDREKVIKLMGAIEMAYHDNRMPQEERGIDPQEFTLDISKFDFAGTPQNIDGKFAFWAMRDRGINKRVIINQNGKQIGDEYSSVGTPRCINGEIVFPANINDSGWFIVDQTGKRISEFYDDVTEPQDIKGKMFLRACKGTSWFIVGPDGKQISDFYDDVGEPREIGKKIVFSARKDKQWYIVDQDGRADPVPYDHVGDPIEIKGEIVFRAEINNIWLIVKQDGTQLGESTDGLGDPKSVGGELVFSRVLPNNKMVMLGPRGKQLGDIFDRVGDPEDVGGELVYWAKEGNRWFIVREDRSRIPLDVDGVISLHPLDEKSCFILAKKGRSYIKRVFDLTQV